MSISQNIERINATLHILATAEVVDNTYGKVTTINSELASILRQLPASHLPDELGEETTDDLQTMATKVIENHLLFGIPERWLIDQVLKSAERIQTLTNSE